MLFLGIPFVTYIYLFCSISQRWNPLFGSPDLARFRAGRHCMQSEPFSLTALSLHVRGPLCCGRNYETPNSKPPLRSIRKVCGVALLSTDASFVKNVSRNPRGESSFGRRQFRRTSKRDVFGRRQFREIPEGNNVFEQ